MADLGNFRGLAVVRLVEAVGTRAYTVSIDDVDPLTAAANQAAWEGNPGASFTLRMEWNISGAPTQTEAFSLTIQMRVPGGAQIGTSWVPRNGVTGPSGLETIGIHLDDDPLNAVLGALRSGMLELYLLIARTGVGSWNADSRGANNGLLAGVTHDHAEGRLRSRLIVASESVSNIALAGAQPSVFAYPDPIHSRVVFSAIAYEAFQAELELLSAASAIEREQTLSASGVNRDWSWTATGGSAGRVGDEMAAASELKDLRLKIPTNQFGGDEKFVFAAAGHDASWVRDSDVQMTAADRLTIDPRATIFRHHFQIDDDAFALAKDQPSKQMLATQSGFLWSRVVNARGEGLNGITLTQLLDPQKPGTAISGSSSTSTQEGQAGWSGRVDWVASKPGGTWDKSVDITAPTDIDSDTHLLTPTDAVVLLAVDSRVGIIVSMVPADVGGDDHLHPGDSVEIVCTFYSRSTQKRLAPDAGSVFMALIRWNVANNRFEYLNADGVTWADWSSTTAVAATFPLTDTGDGVTFTRTFASTEAWTDDLVAVGISGKIDGTPYGSYVPREFVGNNNRHDGYAIDPIGLALSGVISQR